MDTEGSNMIINCRQLVDTANLIIRFAEAVKDAAQQNPMQISHVEINSRIKKGTN